jgi:outer membrane lipoprotein SlyB
VNTMRFSKVAVNLAIFSVLLLAPVVASAPPSSSLSPNSVLGVFVYPQKSQSGTQQQKDESECYASAEQRTGYYPYGEPPSPKPGASMQGNAVRGAAHGAAMGAAVGAITGGNAGSGAAAGALVGGVAGRHQQKVANAQAQAKAEAMAKQEHAQHMDTLRRAYSACLDARGYSVK